MCVVTVNATSTVCVGGTQRPLMNVGYYTKTNEYIPPENKVDLNIRLFQAVLDHEGKRPGL